MTTPRLLFCDTDCLIQLFIARLTPLLKWLKATYSLESVIVPEVELELTWHAKFGSRFESPLKKSISAGLLSVFDYSRPDSRLSDFFSAPQAAITSRSISEIGRKYNLRLGRGEAYSHATCTHLGAPFLSHDKNAIDVLLLNKLEAAAPTLRVFDLMALAYRKNFMDAKKCDSARQVLHLAKEFLPRAFWHASFEEGLCQFRSRLFDRDECTADKPPPCRKFDDPYFLVSTATGPNP